MDDTLFAQLVTAAPPLWGYQTRGLEAIWDAGKNQRGCRVTTGADLTTWHDLSGNGHDLPRLSTSAATLSGDALDLPGGVSYGTSDSFCPADGAPLTMEICLFPENTSTSNNTVFRVGSANTSNRDVFVKITTNKISYGTWGSNTWYDTTAGVHTATLAVDENTQYWYLDGVLLNAKSRKYAGQNKFLYIGASYATSYSYQGKIYTARVYNKTLSAAEVAHNYHIDRARFGSGT